MKIIIDTNPLQDISITNRRDESWVGKGSETPPTPDEFAVGYFTAQIDSWVAQDAKAQESAVVDKFRQLSPESKTIIADAIAAELAKAGAEVVVTP